MKHDQVSAALVLGHYMAEVKSIIKIAVVAM